MYISLVVSCLSEFIINKFKYVLKILLKNLKLKKFNYLIYCVHILIYNIIVILVNKTIENT